MDFRMHGATIKIIEPLCLYFVHQIHNKSKFVVVVYHTTYSVYFIYYIFILLI
jgi:hypothetical protein